MNASEADEADPSLLDAEEAHCSACASIVMLETSPTARNVAAANTAAIKRVVFIVNRDKKVYVYLS